MKTIEGIGIPDSKLCKEFTGLVRDTESELLFNHSSRVYYFGALTGLHFDRELLYAGAMFHDLGRNLSGGFCRFDRIWIKPIGGCHFCDLGL